MGRSFYILILFTACSLLVHSLFGYNVDVEFAKDIQAFLKKKGVDEEPKRLEEALKEIESLKSLLHTILQKSHENNNMDTGDNPYSVHVSPDGEVLPPPFIEEERQKHLSRALNDKQKVILQSRQQEEPSPKATSCFDHHSCDTCLFNGCAWCIGARRCVDDIPWICKGDHDHEVSLCSV